MITLKPGQALSLWQKASMAQVHDDDADLTTRQTGDSVDDLS